MKKILLCCTIVFGALFALPSFADDGMCFDARGGENTVKRLAGSATAAHRHVFENVVNGGQNQSALTFTQLEELVHVFPFLETVTNPSGSITVMWCNILGIPAYNLGRFSNALTPAAISSRYRMFLKLPQHGIFPFVVPGF